MMASFFQQCEVACTVADLVIRAVESYYHEGSDQYYSGSNGYFYNKDNGEFFTKDNGAILEIAVGATLEIGINIYNDACVGIEETQAMPTLIVKTSNDYNDYLQIKSGQMKLRPTYTPSMGKEERKLTFFVARFKTKGRYDLNWTANYNQKVAEKTYNNNSRSEVMTKMHQAVLQVTDASKQTVVPSLDQGAVVYDSKTLTQYALGTTSETYSKGKLAQFLSNPNNMTLYNAFKAQYPNQPFLLQEHGF